MQNCAKSHILHSLSSISYHLRVIQNLNKIRHTSLGMLKKYHYLTLRNMRLQQRNLQSWLGDSMARSIANLSVPLSFLRFRAGWIQLIASRTKHSSNSAILLACAMNHLKPEYTGSFRGIVVFYSFRCTMQDAGAYLNNYPNFRSPFNTHHNLLSWLLHVEP